VRAVVACQQFRTRDVHQLDALLLTTAQPSIEATTEVRIGCFSFFYHELAQQLLKAGLSPFNNRRDISPYLPISALYLHISPHISPYFPGGALPLQQPLGRAVQLHAGPGEGDIGRYREI